MRPPLFATTPSACRPTGGEASPLAASLVHVAPPSVDLNTAASRLNGGAPGLGGGWPGTTGGASDAPRNPIAGYSVANITSGASGAATTDGQPAVSSTKSTLRPCSPAIGCAEDAPLLTRRSVADCADDDLVRIGRADHDRSDVVRFAETDVRPRFPAVGRLVHAVAASLFACADVEDLRVGRRDGERAD